MWQKLKNELVQGRTLLQFGFLQTLGLFIPLVVAKFFPAERFGQYALGEMIIYFFVSLFIACPRIPFILYANQERTQTGKISQSLTIFLMYLTAGFLLFPLICLFFSRFLMKFANTDQRGLWCIALAFFGLALKDVMSNIFMGLNEKIKSAFIEPGYGIIAIIILFGLYFIGILGFNTVFLTYFVSSSLVCFIIIWFLNFKAVWPLQFDKQYFYKMTRFTRWLILGIMAGYIIDWIGVGILGKYASLTDTGTYNLANKFSKGLMSIVYLLPNYFLPHISESLNDSSKIRYYLYHKRPLIFVFGLGCLAAAFFVIPYFITIVYGDKFQDAIPIARIQLLAVAIFLYAAFYGPLFGAMERYKFVQVATAMQAVLSIVLNLVLIPRIGMYGAAIATVASYIYLLIVYEAYFRLKLAKILMPKQV